MKYTLDPLGLIQMNGEVLAQTSLTNSGYTNALIQYISTAGGCGFKNDSRLYDVLQHIQNFFYMLQQGRNQYTYNGKFLIPSQPALIKSSNEQLEEQGGSEEIDSLLTMSELDDIMKIANRTKQTLQNIFMDKTNQSPWLLW
ncbi:MAG: hypothetical protein EZS28_007782 [Streblomastix strix]|uniref:Uncharacterized protein n=1 Tax=Streblomastix strix TaxID=222440 RepID=A0A5J4WPD1_9EUKA|nr:MAG: hypothetical protein EZS28_007782 [Streblomastix strix]